MGDRGRRDDAATGPGGVTERNPDIPASKEGAGILREDVDERDDDTHLPASEEDSDLIEDKDEAPVQSWPGSGGPGTIPPPG